MVIRADRRTRQPFDQQRSFVMPKPSDEPGVFAARELADYGTRVIASEG
jgi:hypothetical protein